MYDQDMKLVERLWHVLVDQGCRPVLVNDEQLTAAVPAAAQGRGPNHPCGAETQVWNPREKKRRGTRDQC